MVLGLSAPVYAQAGSDTGSAGSGSAVVTAPDQGSGAGSGSSATPDKTVIDQLKDIKAQYEQYKSSAPDTKDLALVGLLALIVNLLLTGVKKVMNLTDKGKKWLPWVALSLGVVIAVFQKFAMGGGWAQAIVYGIAGPGAVIIQELQNLFKTDTGSTPSQTPA